jgi:hypothetical protein
MIPVAPSERRCSVGIVGGTLAVFALLLVLAPPLYPSFDESKYLGIGYNMFTGAGPRTIFGALFLLHAPLWPMVVVAPDLWFGVDPFLWGHVLNGLAGLAVLVLVAALGWRIRPAVGALAAVAYIATPYLHDLARTARLDVPAAALTLAYVVVGIDAVRRGSVGRGLLAGAIFAMAFLVKEIVLPFAPVPFFVGILGGRPWATTARVAAATFAVAALGTSWWFVTYAGFTRTVYRLGASSALLVPLYVGIAVVIVAGFAAPWLSSRPAALGWLMRAQARAPAAVFRHSRALAAWGGAFAWFLALVVFFDRNPELKGNGLFRAEQYALYARTWLPTQLPLVLGAVAGAALSLLARRAATPAQREAIDALYLAMLCGLPLVLLVIAVGEPPRNYLAQIGVLAAMSAAGWLWAASLVERITPPRVTAVMPAGLLAASFAIATLLLASHSLDYRASARDSVLQSAVATAADWIEANVAPGATIGFGSFLGYETAVELPARDFRVVQLHQSLAVVDPAAPLALAALRAPPIDDWIAIENSRRETEFYVFRARTFAEQVRRSGISIYVYQTGPITSVPALLGVLVPEHGFTEISSWSYPPILGSGSTTTVTTHIFAVDQAHVGFDGSPMYATADALDRLVGVLERASDTSPTTASNLLESITMWPPSALPEGLLTRLQELARLPADVPPILLRTESTGRRGIIARCVMPSSPSRS